jgi:PAS domain S-box-containing protein
MTSNAAIRRVGPQYFAPLEKYATALLAVLLALLVRHLMHGFLGPNLPYFSFYLAVIVSAWAGGLGPSLLTLVLGAFVADFFFVPPLYSVLQHGSAEWFGIGAFITSGGGVVALAEAHRRALRRTERMHRELRRTQMLFEKFMDNTPAVAYMKDEDGQVTYMNATARRVAGAPGRRKIAGDSSELTQAFRQNDEKVLSGDSAMQFLETTEHEDGEHHWLSLKFPLAESGKRFVAGTSIEITQLIRTQQALLSSESRLRLAQLAARAATFDWDIAQNKMYWPEEYYTVFGLDRSVEPNFENWIKHLHLDDREAMQAAVERAFESGQSELQVDFRTFGSDGRQRWMNARSRIYRNEKGKPIRMIGVALDVTDRKQAEEALIRTEKLASAGRMAASIAHEINNPLEAVMNLLFLAKSEDSKEGVRPYLELADAELKRVAHIARRTLGFYRESSAPSRFRPGDVLNNVLDLLFRKLQKKGITVEKQCYADPELYALEGELRQVISNLIVNSAEAVPQHGKIKIRINKGRNWRNLGQAGVRITIADNGAGISAEDLPHIFEPFFTTKKGSGTGLGLWVSRQIVEKHNGFIHVRSRGRVPNTWTAFSIFLPLAPVAAAASGGKASAAKANAPAA